MAKNKKIDLKKRCGIFKIYMVKKYSLKSKYSFTTIPELRKCLDYIKDSDAFTIYCYLLSRANSETKSCFPSIALISRECHISSRSVIRKIKILDYLNLISKQLPMGDKLNNTYYINYIQDIDTDKIREKSSKNEPISKEVSKVVDKEDNETLRDIPAKTDYLAKGMGYQRLEGGKVDRTLYENWFKKRNNIDKIKELSKIFKTKERFFELGQIIKKLNEQKYSGINYTEPYQIDLLKIKNLSKKHEEEEIERIS